MFIYLFIFPPSYVALWDSKTCHRSAGESVSRCLETSDPYLFCLSFYLLYFVLPPFEYNGLLFQVPYVLCQHSEVVLWNLLGAQMFFWWICRGKSGLPVLFLRHLRTAAPTLSILKNILKPKLLGYKFQRSLIPNLNYFIMFHLVVAMRIKDDFN